MAKKPNYDFERRRKEQDRKKKKDAKREERLLRKRDADGNELPEGSEDGAEPVDGAPVAEQQGDGQPG
ncbi:MAG: hypothetical protein ABIP93_11920 [Gemmatimonadaceae bacterium]